MERREREREMMESKREKRRVLLSSFEAETLNIKNLSTFQKKNLQINREGLEYRKEQTR